MIDPGRADVSDEAWADATASCSELRVARIVEETRDARSIVLEIPDALKETFRYRAGQFLSFKVPYEGRVLVRSYSLSSSPDCDAEYKITVKRVEGGRVSNLLNDALREGDRLMVTRPAGLFVLEPSAPPDRPLVLFSGGSGITPVISLVKSALATTGRSIDLLYANRDEASIIFRTEIEELARRHPDRLRVAHSLDDADGFVDAARVARVAEGRLDADFYLCGPAAFMDLVEAALRSLGADPDRIHVERFVSPPDPQTEAAPPPPGAEVETPESIEILLDGATHEVPYEPGERVLAAARRAGLDPPFSCEEGYCSCCMAKLAVGRVEMAANDCLTEELLEEGWILTCQSRCVSRKIRIEYPE